MSVFSPYLVHFRNHQQVLLWNWLPTEEDGAARRKWKSCYGMQADRNWMELESTETKVDPKQQIKLVSRKIILQPHIFLDFHEVPPKS